MKKDFIGTTKLVLSGLNTERFINLLLKNNIRILQLSRNDSNKLILKIYSQDAEIVKKLASNKIEIETINYGGNVGLFYFFCKRIGIVCGIVVGIILFFIMSTRVCNFDIIGLERLNSTEIINVLNEEGICFGSVINSIDVDEMEELLLHKFDDISLISIVKTGTSIVINIKEKVYDPDLDDSLIAPIVAEYDGIIESVELVQGTALVRAGDVVKKGDILIAPYVISSDGTTNTIKAKGVVKANIWLKGSTQFCENGQKLVRSGNCFSYNLIKLFGMQMPFKVTDNEYEYFEIERTTNFVAKDIVLPMIIENVKVYEMIYIAETKKFSEVEDILVRESVYKAYEQIKDNFEIISEQTDVVEVGGVYYINTYIKVSKNIGIY